MSAYPYFNVNDPNYAKYMSQYGSPEFNPNGDQQNGTYGSMTPTASVNSAAQGQQKSGSDNIFTDALNHVSTFNGALSAQPQSSSAPPYQMPPSMPPYQMPDYGVPPRANPSVPTTAQPVPSQPVYDPASGQWSMTYGAQAQATAPNVWTPEQATNQFYGNSYLFGQPQTTSTPEGGGPPTYTPDQPVPVEQPQPTPQPQPQPQPTPVSGARDRPAAPVTAKNDWLHNDSTGNPWSITNLPPKPANTEDSEVAARWYSQFNFLDPSLVNVTKADVDAFRTSGYTPTEAELANQPGMLRSPFLAWWQNGKPTPAQTPLPGQQPGPIGNGYQPTGSYSEYLGGLWGGTQYTLAQLKGFTPEQRQFVLTPEQLAAYNQQSAPSTPATTGIGGGGGVTVPPDGGVSGTPPAATPPAGTPSPGVPAEEIQKMIDLFNQQKGSNAEMPPLEQLLNPMFKRQRDQLGREMDASAAAQEVIGSGGYGANRAEGLSNLAGQQSAALAGQMGEEYLAKLNQQTQLTQLATEAGMQKYLSDINNDLERYKVSTNADLQRWLTDQNNTLQKYGIDTNDVLQRYLGKLGIDKANIDAGATVNAAALHAAAAEAGAMAAAEASRYASNVNLALGQGNLQVDREKNIGNFILGLLGLGQAGLGNLNDIFSGFPPGSIVVKP